MSVDFTPLDRAEHTMMHVLMQIEAEMGYRGGDRDAWNKVVMRDFGPQFHKFTIALMEFYASHPFDATGERYLKDHITQR